MQDSTPGSPGQQESCKRDRHLRILQATWDYSTPLQAIRQRDREKRMMNAPNKLRIIRSARDSNCESIESENDEDSMLVFRCNKTKFTTSRATIANSRDQLGLSQEDQNLEIQPVTSSIPHEPISPHQYKTQFSHKLDSSCRSNGNRSSCASCGDPDSQLHDTDGVTSCMNMIHVSSPAHPSPNNILPKQVESHERLETNFMTPADRIQNANNNSARGSIIKSRGSANVNPRSSLRKWFDPSMPKKRISFSSIDIVCRTPIGRSAQEVLHEECKKKKAKRRQPELKPKKCRPLSERLPKLVLPPEMKMDPAYSPIAGDIASDSCWINVTRDVRRPPEVQRNVQAIKKIRKELRKPK